MSAEAAADAARSALAINRKHALDVVHAGGGKELKRILAEAEKDLELRLKQAEGLGKAETFNVAQMRATLAQVQQVQRELNTKLGKQLVTNARDAGEQAVGNTFKYLTDAEKAFTGATQPLALAEAKVLTKAVGKAESSVLSRIANGAEGTNGKVGILQRYGTEVVGNFEQKLAVGLITKKPWDEIRQSIIDESPFLQGAPAHWAERIVRTECLVGETSITGAVVRAVHRRWYEGDVIEVVTEGGRKFTTTPNHPMLTARAWVSSGMLHVGDYLVCYVGQKSAGAPGDKHVADAPTTIREVFETLSKIGVVERRRGTENEFHGDGRDGDVDVACADRELAFGRFAPLHKPTAKGVFTPSDFATSSFCLACGRLLSIDEQPCECGGARSEPCISDSFCHSPIVNTKLVRDLLDGDASAEPFNDVRIGKVQHSGMADCGEAVRSGGRLAARDSSLLDKPSDGPLAAVESFGDSEGAHPGEIELDRVVFVERRSFAGYVYNLTTPHGYFAINEAYTGNTMAAFNKAGLETIIEANEDLGDMVKIIVATFDERTAADSYATHGQIRRPQELFETWYGSMMHPPDRPNDRGSTVPHRISWPLPKSLAWKSTGDIAKRWKAEKRKGSPPDRPTMTTVPLKQFGKTPPPKVKSEEP
jgi:hypothetical protein